MSRVPRLVLFGSAEKNERYQKYVCLPILIKAVRAVLAKHSRHLTVIPVKMNAQISTAKRSLRLYGCHELLWIITADL
jgi:hypothetical protein